MSQYMKVRDLIEALSKVDGERLVILQRDPEGNGHSTIAGVDVNCAYNESEQEVYIEALTDELRACGFSEEDTTNGRDGVPAIVLYPTH